MELVRCALFAPKVGHTVIFGASNNTVSWWDNSKATHIGFKPVDTSEVQRERVEAASPPFGPDDPVGVYQGGGFVCLGPFDD